MNGRLRSSSPSVGVRLRSIQQAKQEGRFFECPDRACVGSELGQRLGIAAIYGGKGESDTARAAALLACADVEDTPDNRALVLAEFESIFRQVRHAVIGGGA